MMKVTQDTESDAVYIYATGGPKKVHKTVELSEDLLIDFDSKGNMVGIEMLNVRKVPRKHELRVTVTVPEPKKKSDARPRAVAAPA